MSYLPIWCVFDDADFFSTFLTSIHSLYPIFITNILFQANKACSLAFLRRWLVNFFPFDLFFKIVSFPLIKIPLIAVDQMVRVVSIKASIDAATAVFPNSICAPILVGTITGLSTSLNTD